MPSDPNTTSNQLRGRRILVTGGAGFLGRHVCEQLESYAPAKLIIPRSAEWDLREPLQIRKLFSTEKPQVILHLAAVVGGIGANRDNPGLYFYENAVMAIHLMEEARRFGIEKICRPGDDLFLSQIHSGAISRR